MSCSTNVAIKTNDTWQCKCRKLHVGYFTVTINLDSKRSILLNLPTMMSDTWLNAWIMWWNYKIAADKRPYIRHYSRHKAPNTMRLLPRGRLAIGSQKLIVKYKVTCDFIPVHKLLLLLGEYKSQSIQKMLTRIIKAHNESNRSAWLANCRGGTPYYWNARVTNYGTL